MWFKGFLLLCGLAAIYAGYELFSAARYYQIVQTPPADFMVVNKDTGKIPVIQFMDLNDENNKKTNLLLMAYAETHPDVLYMVRPVFRTGGTDQQEVKILIAAGLQGRYWEFLKMVSEYGPFDDAFLKENAGVINLDLDRLRDDAAKPEVAEIMQKNFDAVEKSGVETTQTLMVGRNIYYLSGPLTQEDLDRMIGNESP